MVAVVLLAISLIGQDSAAASSAGGPPLDRGQNTLAGEWLLHLARHHGHVSGRGNPRAVTLHSLALMNAAGRVSPDLAEAHLWQFDLYSRIERPEEAEAALARYVELRPRDETAWLHLIASEIEKRQTAEARAEFLQQQLSRPEQPRSVASDLHRRLAEFHRERRELDLARRHIEESLRLLASNVAARQLSYELFGETEPALQRVELALQLVAASPAQVNLLWELGQMLDSLSLHREAQEWYLRAIDLHERVSKAPVPAIHWYELAQSYSNSGDLKEAAGAIDKALAADPTFGRAKILKSFIAGRLKAPDAEASLNELAVAYEAEAHEVLKARNVAKAGELAWFFAFHRPDPDLSLKLAQLAASVPSPGSLAQRALGFALLLNREYEQAIQTLKPLSDVDQLAAVGLAQALMELRRQNEAIPVLHKAAHLNYSGVAYEAASMMLERLGEKPPGRPEHKKIVEALYRFDRRVFDFHKSAGDFLRLTLRFVDDPLPPAGPWRVTVRAENVGPFPITLGEGMMAQPLVLFSARLGTAPEGVHENYLQLLLNRRAVLLPGDAIEETVAVDVGRLREQALSRISATESLEVSAVFDPVLTSSGYGRGISTVAATPVQAQRIGVPRDTERLGRIVAQLSAPAVGERLAAIDILGAVLREAANSSEGEASPEAAIAAIRKRLAALACDEDWIVRARVLEALRWSPQPQDVMTQVSQAVRDPHFVVRIAALRFFASQQGAKFRRVLEAMGQSDPDPAVRLLARSYVEPAGK